MKKIICTAEAFGYGPVSKLLAVCSKLTRHELHFFGSDVAMELARHEDFFTTVNPCGFNGTGEGESYSAAVKSADLVINVLKPDILDLTAGIDTPNVYIDSLFWMWDRIPDPCKEVDRYVIQQFPGIENKINEMGNGIKHIDTVNPIVDRSLLQTREREETVLINLSGLETPFAKFGETLKYHEPVARCIARAAARSKWKKIIVSGNANVMKYLQQIHGHDRLTFQHLSHSQFLELLNRVGLLVTSPGLTATYEALVYNTPIRFLPAQNYSQALMQEKYKQNGFADIAMDWGTFYPDWQIAADMPEELGVKMVMDVIDQFTRDEHAQFNVEEALLNALNQPPPNPDRQKATFGIDLQDGAQQTADICEAIIYNPN